MIQPYYIDFIRESNKIEGIHREPTQKEIDEFLRFIYLDEMKIADLKKFVSIYAPGHVIRNKAHLNVSVGGYRAPLGGPRVVARLQEILDDMNDLGPYKTHVNYELLHPFTDGNGRSGRALWSWQMIKCSYGEFPPLGFLHHFYYQTLKNEGTNNAK